MNELWPTSACGKELLDNAIETGAETRKMPQNRCAARRQPCNTPVDNAACNKSCYGV